MRRFLALTAVALPLLSGSACKGSNKPPLEGSGGRTSVSVGTGGTNDAGYDAGNVDDDSGALMVDGGSTSLPFPLECVQTDPALFTNEDILPDNRGPGVSMPTDLVITRALATWDASCTMPTVQVRLSGGTCPAGDGHELVLSFSAKAIQDGVIGLGQNNLIPESDASGMHVSYVRPKKLVPTGTWGDCAGSIGQIVFPDAPDVSKPGIFRARFQLELASCDGSKQKSQTVVGWFKVQLRRGLSTVCP